MSIRIKLMITYAVLVLISAVVIVFSGIHIFSSTVSNIVDEVFVKTNFQENMTEIVDVISEIKFTEKYQADRLMTQEFVNELKGRLSFYNGGIVMKSQGDLIASDNLNLSEKTLSKLKPVRHESDYENYLVEGEQKYMYFNHSFNLDDKKVTYYFLVDTSNLEDIQMSVGGKFLRSILLVIIIIMAPVLVIITKDIIDPLRKLEIGVNHIKDGDLDFKLESKKHNEIGRVIQSFETMRSKLKGSLDKQVKFEENRKELISSISHDLKTPIASIKGHVEGIKDGVANTPEKLEKYLDVIYQKSMDMDTLIDDLFLFSKLDLNKIPFDLRPVPISDFLEEIVSEMTLDFQGDNEHLTLDNQMTDNKLVLIDPIQMKRVLVNIMQNAMKYMDKDEKFIDVSLKAKQGKIQIVIADNGQGIEKEHLEFIFDRFYRVDESRNPETGGTGLGLAIAKQIIGQHQGQIKVSSDYGIGTKIMIELNEVEDDKNTHS